MGYSNFMESDSYKYEIVDTLDYDNYSGDGITFSLLTAGQETLAALDGIKEYTGEFDFINRLSSELSLLSDTYEDMIDNFSDMYDAFISDKYPEYYSGKDLLEDKGYNHLVSKSIKGDKVRYKITDLNKKKINHPQCEISTTSGDELEVFKDTDIYNFIETVLYKFNQLENAYYNIYVEIKKIEGEKNSTKVKMKFDKESYIDNYNNSKLIDGLEEEYDVNAQYNKEMDYYGFGDYYVLNNQNKPIACLSGINTSHDIWDFLYELSDKIKKITIDYQDLVIETPHDIMQKIPEFKNKNLLNLRDVPEELSSDDPNWRILDKDTDGDTITYYIIDDDYDKEDWYFIEINKTGKDEVLYQFLEFIYEHLNRLSNLYGEVDNLISIKEYKESLSIV